jgi:putative transposase
LPKEVIRASLKESNKINQRKEHEMTTATMAFTEFLRKIGKEEDMDFLREGVQVLTQALMELEISQQVGAGRYEHSGERTTYRNGYRDRLWQTRVGDIELRVPKVRDGSYFPSFLEPRRRPEQALLAVVQQAYIEGVSTRKVDDLVQSLGLSGIDKSAVSRICKQLDEVVDAFRNRPLERAYPYVWLDALYLKVRINGRVVSQALVIAIGVRETGERDVLGVELGAAENRAFWLDFLRKLVRRGLNGVQLVISDAHEGLKEAIQQVFAGASWQRCRVHFMRHVLAYVPHGEKSLVSALLRTVFAQPGREDAEVQWDQVYQQMSKRWPQAAAVMADAREDVLAYMAFPQAHWTRIYSTNPLERLNKEVKRRTHVVGVFPDPAATIRLVGAVLLEVDDEWQAGKRYFSQQSMRQLFDPEPVIPTTAIRHAPVLAPVH